MMNEKSSIVIPGWQIPSFRTSAAIERGVEKNILIRCWGGIGDRICSEPAIRYALETFRDCKISLATEEPELFGHLDFEKVYRLGVDEIPEQDYLVFNTIMSPETLSWDFVNHLLMNCVDYPSVCAWKCQIPISYKQVRLVPSRSVEAEVESIMIENKLSGDDRVRWIAVHAGKHWPSKTFPKEWWDDVLSKLKECGLTPVLIGADADDNRGTVDVDTSGCIDLRNRLSLMQSVRLLQRARGVITNDSSPLHMAATGDAWIGFLASCKHPDFLTHWRGPRGEFGWNMQNLSRGGVWEIMDYLPNKGQSISVDKIPRGIVRTWLPEPYEIAYLANRKIPELPLRKAEYERCEADTAH